MSSLIRNAISFIVIISMLYISCYGKPQKTGDEVEEIENENRFDPDVLTARMYDYTTNTIAYKDKPSRKCYIQRIQKNNRLPLYVSQLSSDSKEVSALAGDGIARFCAGLETYKLLVPVKRQPK